MSRVFFDSNVLLYGFASNNPRSARAQALIEAGGAISVQCLNEFASVAKGKVAMSWERVNEALAVVMALCSPIVPLDVVLHRRGLFIAEKYRLSIYDGMIVAAALTAGCDILYSEDMHHGLKVDGQLRIENPFLV